MIDGAPDHDTDPAATGVAGLDNILGGGFPRNHIYLVEGDPGAGKTTLSLQYLLEGRAQGETGLYVTLSETKRELTKVARSHGWSLEGIEIFELIPSEENLQADSQYTMYHASEVELSETTRAVLEVVDRKKPTRVVVDSLSELRLLAQNPLRYRRQILALKQFFAGRSCTVLLLDDRTAEVRDLQVQSVAHGVVLLDQLSPLYGAERRRLRVAKLRGVAYRGGHHDFIIRRGGLQVFPRLVAAEHSERFERSDLPSGVPGLDQLLGGGLRRGTSTLLLGPAGVGKSTVAMQYALAAVARGERAAIFSFEEALGTILDRSEGLGMPVQEGLERGSLTIQGIDPAELSPGEFVASIRESVETHGARLIIIDSLNGYLNAMPEERFLIIQLHELLTYLSHRGVSAIIIVAQHGMLGQMHTPVDASYLADTLLVLRFFEARGEICQAISVVKKRSGKHERTIRALHLDENGIRVGEPLRHLQGIFSGIPSVVTEEAGASHGLDDGRH